jgi:hypothetical protein
MIRRGWIGWIGLIWMLMGRRRMRGEDTPYIIPKCHLRNAILAMDHCKACQLKRF